jgi:hypothetical protein
METFVTRVGIIDENYCHSRRARRLPVPLLPQGHIAHQCRRFPRERTLRNMFINNHLTIGFIARLSVSVFRLVHHDVDQIEMAGELGGESSGVPGAVGTEQIAPE